MICMNCGKHVVGQVADQLHVGLQSAGVFRQIFSIVELHGIHEDGAEHHIVFLVCAAYEGEMSFMQSPHGGHHADAFAGGTLANSNVYQLSNRINYCHIDL